MTDHYGYDKLKAASKLLRNAVRTKLFPLGRLRATPGALEALSGGDLIADFASIIGSHAAGWWGELDAEDKAANDKAVKDGGRILSAYFLSDGVTKVWVLTEADRSVTTILLPEEY
jgi:hypothetical protein